MIQTYDIPIFDPDSMDLDEPGEALPKNNSSKEYYIYNTPKTNKFKNTEEKINTNSLNEENKKDDFYLLSKELILSSIKKDKKKKRNKNNDNKILKYLYFINKDSYGQNVVLNYYKNGYKETKQENKTEKKLAQLKTEINNKEETNIINKIQNIELDKSSELDEINYNRFISFENSEKDKKKCLKKNK